MLVKELITWIVASLTLAPAAGGAVVVVEGGGGVHRRDRGIPT